MANISSTSFKNWNDGDTMKEADYEKEREIIRVAINDNYTKILDRYTKAETDTKINNALLGGGQSKVIEIGTILPSTGTDGQLFLNNSTGVIYQYLNSVWEPATVILSGTALPTGTFKTGQMFWRTDEKILYIYNAGTNLWEIVIPYKSDLEILNQVKNVDGENSGLDADTVDGKHASELSEMFKIAEFETSSNVASVSFASIPQIYKMLRIIIVAKSTFTISSNTAIQLRMRYNDDSTASYDTNYNGTVETGANGNRVGSIMGNHVADIERLGHVIIDIANYTFTGKFKYFTSRSVVNLTNNEYLSGVWRNTNAITKITLFGNSDDILSGSTFILYGIK